MAYPASHKLLIGGPHLHHRLRGLARIEFKVENAWSTLCHAGPLQLLLLGAPRLLHIGDEQVDKIALLA